MEKRADTDTHGFKPGTFHPDPFADDKVRLKITAQNYQEHADQLSEGRNMMFKTYDDYVMNIYPTRRSMIYGNYIYEAVLENLDRAVFERTDSHMGMIGFTGARRAWASPFQTTRMRLSSISNHGRNWSGISREK